MGGGGGGGEGEKRERLLCENIRTGWQNILIKLLKETTRAWLELNLTPAWYHFEMGGQHLLLLLLNGTLI